MSAAEPKFHIHRHRAVEDPATDAAFTSGLLAAYRRFGCEVAARTGTLHDLETHLLVVRDMDTGDVVGGARLYVSAAREVLLPVERTLLALEPCPTDGRLWDERHGTGEVGAVWVSEAARGWELPWRLIQEAMALALELGMVRLVAFSSPHMMAVFSRAGFELDRRFGHRGVFPYPDARYLSGVMVLGDPGTWAARVAPEKLAA